MSGSETTNTPACGVRKHELLRLRFGELAEGEAARIRGHLDGCPFCRARMGELDADEKAFLAAGDAGIASAKILERLEAPSKLEARASGIRALLGGKLLRPLAVAAVLLISAVPAAILLRGEHGTRTKGGGVALEMFVNDPAVGARAARDGAILREGDQIQFRYRADGKRYVFVVSVTDRGVLSPLYPDRPGPSVEIAPAGTHVLAGSVILDDARGPERIFALFSDSPLSFDEVKASIDESLKKERSVTRLQALDLGREDVVEATVLIQKE
jgi:anti-sigma factor RsiW